LHITPNLAVIFARKPIASKAICRARATVRKGDYTDNNLIDKNYQKPRQNLVDSFSRLHNAMNNSMLQATFTSHC